ncbi:MAG TPA: hypothetical protein VKZ79_01505 [Alphaproteobacteria bacterium]|nr:hypothetical protein [Alphaproteobacteria bacterium]
MATVIDKPVTAARVRQMLGDLDDVTIARIVALGATEAEVLEAFQWASADDELGTETERLPAGRVGEIYEILQSELPDEEQ